MEKEDIQEFREALQRMSDEDTEDKKESLPRDDQEKILELYQEEVSKIEQEKEALKKENSRLSSSVGNGDIREKDCVAEEVLVTEAQSKDDTQTLPDNDQDRDDLSSIFSEDEEDLRSLVEGSDTIRKALKNLRKERDFWITDTASETSDDGDTSVSARSSVRDTTADRIQISKLLAEKEFLELKLSQVTNDKKETETKLKFLEKSDVKRRHEASNARLNQSEPKPRIESTMQPPKQGDHKKHREAPKPHTQRHKHKNHSEHGMTNAELLQFLRSRSISPQLVKGYEDDIAILAEENAKLGEIIDHLHINPDEEESPTIDPMAAFMDAYEHRVPQEEYMRLESEKMRLEHLVREKDRQIKERDRIIEETKFEFEDEVKLLKESLKRAEQKVIVKTKEMNEYEITIIELKSSFEEQIATAANELQIRNEQKMRLEEMNANLMETNKKCQIEIENLKTSLSKLNAREKEIEKKYNNELKVLEEKYQNENREKMQLSENFEGLMSDLMVLKTKLLQDGNKTARMREGFEKERTDLGGEELSVNPRFANLSLHLRNKSHDEKGQQPIADPQAANQQAVTMESNEVNLSMQTDISGYMMLIQNQNEKIEMLERANQELNDKLLQAIQQQQQKPFSDVSTVYSETSLEGQIQSPMPGSQLIPGNQPTIQGDTSQHQHDLNNNPSRPTSAMKYEMDEIVQENTYLKTKLDDLGKEKMKRRELEEKNEELQEEISQMAKKRNEVQKKQEHMSTEIEEMNEKVEELEKCNAKLTKEADQLINKIKEMEESFNEEKEKLTLSNEKEREKSDKAFEKEQERLKEMEEEIENLQEEINSLTKQNKELKNKYNRELGNERKEDASEMEEEIETMRDEITSLLKQNKDMKNKYNKQIENLKRQHLEEMDNLDENEDGQQTIQQLKKVETQWKTKLQNTIKKYDEQLKKSEEEKKKLLASLRKTQGSISKPQGTSQGAAEELMEEIMESPESAYNVESECPLETAQAQLFTPDDGDIQQEAQHAGEETRRAKVMNINDYNPNNEPEDLENEPVIRPPLKQSYSITDIELDDETGDGLIENPRFSDDEDFPTGKVLDTRVHASPKSVHGKHRIDHDGIQLEYPSIVPNVQIQVELENDEGRGSTARSSRIDSNMYKKLEENNIQLQKALNQKQNELLSLTQKIGQLEQQLVAKNGEIALLQEREKNASVVFQTKMDDKTKHYQDLLEKLKTKLQGEKKELEERLNKDSEEMQRLMKEEFQKSLSSKSGVLENKLQELVADKVKVYKEQIKKLDGLLQNSKEKLNQFEKGEDDRTKRLERERKVLRATIQALTKELNKAKQDRKELKKEFKKGKADMKNATEEERKCFEESLETAKEVQKLKIEEDMRNKYSIDVEKYEGKLEQMNDEIQQYETKMEEMAIKFKEDKFKLESDLQDSMVELDSMKETQKEFKVSLEEEYKRKLRKEKQNIEITLESLRQEIARLRENRQHLETQLQQNAQYKLDKDSGYQTSHAPSPDNFFNNKEIFNRIENEYQQQLQREKEYYESKIQDLEDDYEGLSKEISRMKTKYRQERIGMQSEFEKEKAFLEERFEREKREIQASLQFRLSSMRDPRVSFIFLFLF